MILQYIVQKIVPPVYAQDTIPQDVSGDFSTGSTAQPVLNTDGLRDNATFQEFVADLILKGSRYAVTIIVALTVLVFLYGMMKYMYKGQESDTARSDGRKLMLWGVIGLFVMMSVWTIVAILASTIGHTDVGIPQF